MSDDTEAIPDLDNLESSDQVLYDPETGRPFLFVDVSVADRRSDKHPYGVEPGAAPTAKYFAAVEANVGAERPQGRRLRRLVEVFDVPVVLVVYIKNELRTAGFWVKVMDSPHPWHWMTCDDFHARLHLARRIADVALNRGEGEDGAPTPPLTDDRA